MQSQNIKTTCCIVGGGPAGIMLGYLFARSGIAVTVLEKHADFLRDFRGDTIHPSTFQLLDELGLLEQMLKLIDFQSAQLMINFEGQEIAGPTFRHLKLKTNFIGFVPQWDFLNLLTREASKFPNFELRMKTSGNEVIRDNGKVVGVRAKTNDGELEIFADLVVAADGRSSTIRSSCDLKVIDMGVPIDALWFRMERPVQNENHTLAWLKNGHMLITIPRKDHYQAAMVIRKGGFQSIQNKGIEEFRNTIADVCPLLSDASAKIQSWDEVKLLTVQINRLEKWCEEGLLFIGDAAHAMSPMGGVGINLAIQDAVAAANRLASPLIESRLKISDLEAVQKRRESASTKTQKLQTRIHATLFGGNQSPDQTILIPWYLRYGAWIFAPVLRRIAGRLIGLGYQHEHIQPPVNKS